MAEAQRILDENLLHIEKLRGGRIRVVRALVFEGDAEAVLMQIAKSMAEGKHFHNGRRFDKSYGEFTITIASGPIQPIP